MALSDKEIKEVRKAIEESHRPLVFFDDDCDGLSSFLQVYSFVGDGRGIPVKDSSEVEEKYVQKIVEYMPDLVLILDKPKVSQDFLDKVKQKVIWIDHHEPQHQKGVDYYNPRIDNDEDNRPTSYWIYQILKKDLWLAMTGIIADWFFPEDLIGEFREKYPELLPINITTAPQALHDSVLGKLIRIWSFNLKGTVFDTLSSIKTLTRVNDPYEILDQTTPQGKYIYKKYDKLRERYDNLLKSIKIPEDKLLVFTYGDMGHSFTSDLSNEILYRHPDKITIIGRIDKGFVKCSLRSGSVKISDILEECLKGVEGYGGGHPLACGACIKEEDFSDFISCFSKKI